MTIIFEDIRTNPLSFMVADCGILFKGPDAGAYLDSQCTNSVSKLKPKEFHFNSILDLTGKIIGSFVLARISEDHFEIYFQNQFYESILERIERYHISEDFEVEKISKPIFLNTNSSEHELKGKYFFEGDSIGEKPKALLAGAEDFLKLRVLTGVPLLGEEAKTGDLVNNTYFDELSVDYKKGCFPGQETVSKIQTRRGAAYKPVLMISTNSYEGNLEWEGKKIGKVLNSFEDGGKFYHYVSMLRNYRIDGSNLGDMQIFYYPYIATDRKSLASELYDRAVELFQANYDEKAKEYFERALELDPGFEDAYESLGVLYGRMENFEKAIELMEQLKSINSKSMMAYTNLSLYHMKLGNIKTAEDYKSQATLLNFEILGDEAEKKRKQDELQKQKQIDRDRREGMFLQVLEMDSEDAMANNGMGEILLEKNQPELASKHFKAAIDSDKKYSVAYLGLAKCFIKLNKLKELEETLSRGIEVAGKNGDLMPANEMQSLRSQYLS
ncbi:MAG: hypothetical protein CME65_11815 [Halobacteriovoraceae bacterium]|nr:hypothetical protein [Halobacteriovoraceae bacterium]|tara:strand:+ start:11707 stop:13203 length:1497 start_codon:yes stop_codon:yes gene_type:complete